MQKSQIFIQSLPPSSPHSTVVCPMEAVTPPDPVPRLLVIDACNIARSSCGPKREYDRLS